MEFTPANHVVKLCLQAMRAEGTGQSDEAKALFAQAWHAAADDFEHFLAAYYLARHQSSVRDRLKWLDTALLHASRIDDPAARSALPALHAGIATCHDELQDPVNAREHHQLAASLADAILDTGPFYHGTKADLHIGDLLTAGGSSNYQSDLTMNHIYFTALENGAGLAAALGRGDGRERVYVVEPTGPFEHDPNVTDQKFPGNLTRSYRSRAPLRIIGEATAWVKAAPEDLRGWREKLASGKGKIIN